MLGKNNKNPSSNHQQSSYSLMNGEYNKSKDAKKEREWQIKIALKVEDEQVKVGVESFKHSYSDAEYVKHLSERLTGIYEFILVTASIEPGFELQETQKQLKEYLENSDLVYNFVQETQNSVVDKRYWILWEKFLTEINDACLQIIKESNDKSLLKKPIASPPDDKLRLERLEKMKEAGRVLTADLERLKAQMNPSSRKNTQDAKKEREWRAKIEVNVGTAGRPSSVSIDIFPKKKSILHKEIFRNELISELTEIYILISSKVSSSPGFKDEQVDMMLEHLENSEKIYNFVEQARKKGFPHREKGKTKEKEKYQQERNVLVASLEAECLEILKKSSSSLKMEMPKREWEVEISINEKEGALDVVVKPQEGSDLCVDEEAVSNLALQLTDIYGAILAKVREQPGYKVDKIPELILYLENSELIYNFVKDTQSIISMHTQSVISMREYADKWDELLKKVDAECLKIIAENNSDSHKKESLVSLADDKSQPKSAQESDEELVEHMRIAKSYLNTRLISRWKDAGFRQEIVKTILLPNLLTMDLYQQCLVNMESIITANRQKITDRFKLVEAVKICVDKFIDSDPLTASLSAPSYDRVGGMKIIEEKIAELEFINKKIEIKTEIKKPPITTSFISSSSPSVVSSSTGAIQAKPAVPKNNSPQPSQVPVLITQKQEKVEEEKIPVIQSLAEFSWTVKNGGRSIDLALGQDFSKQETENPQRAKSKNNSYVRFDKQDEKQLSSNIIDLINSAYGLLRAKEYSKAETRFLSTLTALDVRAKISKFSKEKPADALQVLGKISIYYYLSQCAENSKSYIKGIMYCDKSLEVVWQQMQLLEVDSSSPRYKQLEQIELKITARKEELQKLLDIENSQKKLVSMVKDSTPIASVPVIVLPSLDIPVSAAPAASLVEKPKKLSHRKIKQQKEKAAAAAEAEVLRQAAINKQEEKVEVIENSDSLMQEEIVQLTQQVVELEKYLVRLCQGDELMKKEKIHEKADVSKISAQLASLAQRFGSRQTPQLSTLKSRLQKIEKYKVIISNIFLSIGQLEHQSKGYIEEVARHTADKDKWLLTAKDEENRSLIIKNFEKNSERSLLNLMKYEESLHKIKNIVADLQARNPQLKSDSKEALLLASSMQSVLSSSSSSLSSVAASPPVHTIKDAQATVAPLNLANGS